MTISVPADHETLESHVEDHLAVVRAVGELLPTVTMIAGEVWERLGRGGILYSFGNGGSAADAQHLVGELIGRYRRERRPLAAVSLSTDPTVSTCIANDYSFADVFARQLSALTRKDDVVVGFTTSGRSSNVVEGLRVARANGALTVLFGGGDGRPAADHADLVLLVPSPRTARVQEAHVLLLHLLSEQLDRWAADEA